MTSAPKSAISVAARAAATKLAQSMTFSPSNKLWPMTDASLFADRSFLLILSSAVSPPA
jgi:hypothetical protein